MVCFFISQETYKGICDIATPLFPIKEKRHNVFMSQITEDQLKDINDPEYNRLLDDATKNHRTAKSKILDAARRLESLG